MAWRAGLWPAGRLLHTPGLEVSFRSEAYAYSESVCFGSRADFISHSFCERTAISSNGHFQFYNS